MLAHRPPESLRLIGREARDKTAGVLMLGFRTGLLDPLTMDFDGTVRRKESGVHGAERLDGGAPRFDASVVVLPVGTQVKKGVS
jgi:hypothetical protein